jgi:hypothetical protein
VDESTSALPFPIETELRKPVHTVGEGTHGKKPLTEGFIVQVPKGFIFTIGALSLVVAAMLPLY